MDAQWSEFKSAPSAFVLARKANIGALVGAMTKVCVDQHTLSFILVQVIVSEQDKDEQLKVLILNTWQEMVHDNMNSALLT